jgi:hypothetical protein
MKLGRQVDVDWSLVDLEGRAASITVDNTPSIRSLSIVYRLFTYCLHIVDVEEVQSSCEERSRIAAVMIISNQDMRLELLNHRISGSGSMR